MSLGCGETRNLDNLTPTAVLHPATDGPLQIKRIQPFTMPLMSLAATALDQPKHRDEVIATMLQVWAVDRPGLHSAGQQGAEALLKHGMNGACSGWGRGGGPAVGIVAGSIAGAPNASWHRLRASLSAAPLCPVSAHGLSHLP